nr:hypothetical protein [Clostridia bacterium]
IKNGIVSSDQYHGQAIFFKGIESDSYSYSVNVKITEESWGLNGHAGVCDMIDSELFHIFYVSGSSVLSGTRTLNFHTLNFFRDGKTSSNWHDTNEGNYTVPSGKDPFNDGVEIKVIKQKEKFFYFIYDDLVLVKEIYQIQGKTCPGLYTLSRKAVFTNYSVTDYTGRESEINALIKESAYKVFAPGNISGGLISSNSAALVLENGNVKSDLVLNVLPYSGYILTSLNLRGTVYEGVSSSLQFFADRCREGVLVIPKEDIIDDVVVTADFTYITRCGISASDIVAVKGNVQKRNGTKASNTAVYIYNEYATLCYSTTTTSDGNYSFLLPKDGTVLNGHTVDGNYTLVINGYNYGYGFIEKIIDIPDTHSGDIINNFILDTLEVVSSGNDLFVSENGHQRIESLGTVVSDGNAHYKTSEKITEIPL